MVVTWILQKIKHAPCCPGFGIGSTKYHPRDTRMHQCHGTHRTRLQSDIHRAPQQTMITPHTPCGAQRNDFGMRTGIMLADIAIPTFTKQHSVGADNHRAYRDFIVFVACMALMWLFAGLAQSF